MSTSVGLGVVVAHGPLTPLVQVRFLQPLPKKSTSFDLSIFLFKPQAWYVITRQRVWYRRRRMASPKVHFLRLDSIPSCNGFHTMLCIDSIHASRRDVAHEFKSIRKPSKKTFSQLYAKRKQNTACVLFIAICVNKRFDTSVKSPYNIYSINQSTEIGGNYET